MFDPAPGFNEAAAYHCGKRGGRLLRLTEPIAELQ